MMGMISIRFGGTTDTSQVYIYTDWNILKEVVRSFDEIPNWETPKLQN
jgi:menaquinone-dependent protoporphyrinogen IX oxidase